MSSIVCRVKRFRCSAWANRKMSPISSASSPQSVPAISLAPRSISMGGYRGQYNAHRTREQKPSTRNIMPSKRHDAATTTRLTPTDMMQQYQRIKAQYQDAILLFRFGDFYEMFGEDAECVARELQLVLTSRPQGKGMERVPMCGIPFYRVDGYIARLIARGHKVAVCEQLEEASLAKRLVERGVVRVVTPGTLYEVGEGETFLVALWPVEQRLGVVWLELSTGEFFGTESWPAELPSLFAKFPPRELLLPTGQEHWTAGLRSWMQRMPPITVRE